MSTGCDTSGDAGAVAVKSVNDRSAGEIEEPRTPRRKEIVVGVQDAAGARSQKYRAEQRRCSRLRCSMGCAVAAGLQLEPRGGSRSCRRGVTRAATRARSP